LQVTLQFAPGTHPALQLGATVVVLVMFFTLEHAFAVHDEEPAGQ